MLFRDFLLSVKLCLAEFSGKVGQDVKSWQVAISAQEALGTGEDSLQRAHGGVCLEKHYFPSSASCKL